YLTPGNGAMRTGWVLDGSTWYYCSGSGAMQTGWLSTGGSWYYLKSSGAMVSASSKDEDKIIGNKAYVFADDGKWIPTDTQAQRLKIAKERAAELAGSLFTGPMTHMEKANAVYNYLRLNIELQTGTATAGTYTSEAFGAFMFGKASSAGYAEAAALLCIEGGMKATSSSDGTTTIDLYEGGRIVEVTMNAYSGIAPKIVDADK
ncbi:MAG TPA: hypothetical protein IAC28_04385, partial [Candidatus Aphodovivens excrementavium]|nr:hypothetical protein [Candidatus Aphodovivens excrementavium]